MTTTETTTETTTTETTMETTIKMTTTPTTTTLNVTISKNTSGNGTQTSVSSYTTVFPATGNTTNFQSSNSSAGNTTANSTAVPVSSSTAMSRTNTTANSSNWVPHFGIKTTSSSSAVPTSATGGGTVIPTSSTKGNESSSTQVVPTWRTSVTAQGSMAPRQTPTAVLGSSGSPNPHKTTALLPTAVQLLLHISLSFRIINRSFNESLRDPTSKEYRSLSHTVLTMFEYVFGCASCVGGQTYKGCSELRFSQGSVEVQSTLVFGHGNDTVTSDAAEQQLRNSLDQNGFIMDLQLASIQSEWELQAGGVRVDGSLWECPGGLHKRCPILAGAGRLFGCGTGSGLAAGRANAVSQCLWRTALGRLTGPCGGGLIPSCPILGVSQACLSWPALWLCPAAQTRLWSSFRHCGRGIPGTSAHGPGLGHCSAGPGVHPAAAEHPHLPSDGESPIPIPVLTCLLLVGPLSPCPQAPDPFPLPRRPPAPAAGKAEGSWTCSAQRTPTTPWPSTPHTRATGATCHPTASPTPTARWPAATVQGPAPSPTLTLLLPLTTCEGCTGMKGDCRGEGVAAAPHSQASSTSPGRVPRCCSAPCLGQQERDGSGAAGFMRMTELDEQRFGGGREGTQHPLAPALAWLCNPAPCCG
ncbi:mucin-1 isoform 1-T1 [Morphnus guianensis]